MLIPLKVLLCTIETISEFFKDSESCGWKIVELCILLLSVGVTYYACKIAIQNSQKSSDEQTALNMLNSILDAMRTVRQEGKLNTTLYEKGVHKDYRESAEGFKIQCKAFFRSRKDVVTLLFLLNAFWGFVGRNKELDREEYSNILNNSIDSNTMFWLWKMSECIGVCPECNSFFENSKGVFFMLEDEDDF